MPTRTPPDLATGWWQLDAARSSVGFEVSSLYGLATIKGGFRRYVGTLNLSDPPAVALVIEADSLDTGNRRRDEHLRSFLDAAEYPWVRFEADGAELDGEALRLRGVLYAAGKQVSIDVDAAVTAVGEEFEIEASAVVGHTRLGVRGRLLRAGSGKSMDLRRPAIPPAGMSRHG